MALQEKARRIKLREAQQREPIGMLEFLERTSGIAPDPWQRDLCTHLDRFRTERGLRYAIHAPPQHGKSVIVSQRLPAWLLGHLPTERVKLASYNISHATAFGRVVRDLMHSQEYLDIFPAPDSRLPKQCSAEGFTTLKRGELNDAQPSFKALGLQTGFVGQGVDTLVIDDPYAAPEDAYSQIINDRTYQFWTDTAKPRLSETSNVLLMFHRYAENDIAGRMLAEGGWTLLRYSAICDGDYELPETQESWADPLGREEGERLSPRFSYEHYEKQMENSFVWLSQFQGRPTSKSGQFFKIEHLQANIIDAIPRGVTLKQVRAWDLASSRKGDYTVGVKMGKGSDGRIYVLDVARGRYLPDERNELIRTRASFDTRATRIFIPQDPGQAGVDQVRTLTRMLAGYNVNSATNTGSKATRADAFASQVNVGNVCLLRAPWNHVYIEELRQFDRGRYDDQVDASSDAYRELAHGRSAQVHEFRI